MDWTLSEASKQAIAEEATKYPTRRSALMPALHIAQRQFGWLSEAAIEAVAKELGVPVADAQGVVTFYTMYRTKPVGRYHIQVCQNLSCSLMGAEGLIGYLEKKLGVKCGETSPDGKFTISRVECLAACGTAPVMQVNDTYYEKLTPQKVDDLVAGWAKS
ncbi:MAG: NADH-quinone oxidoreductase subunit NuoE [Deltaproteobacteria bacterium]|nr:NADH-quinone oxidoreductase subunit NuoE [Deltaproteobacteria bacterium]